MKNTFLLLITVFSFALSTVAAQDKVRYTQKAKEIDLVMSLEKAYNSGQWDNYVSLYQADAALDHNGISVTPKQAAASFQQTINDCSFYQLTLLPAELERIINDRGEIWVNSWGVWQGIPKGSADTVTMPVHLVFEFKDNKIVREFGFYDLGKLKDAMAVASYGKDQLLYITEDTPKEGQKENYHNLVIRYRKALEASNGPEFNWLTATTSDNKYLHQISIASIADMQTKSIIRDKAVAAMEEEEAQAINAIFLNSVASRKEYVVRRHASRSYWPEKGFDQSPGFLRMLKMTVSPENYPTLMGLANEIVAISKEGESPMAYGFFTYEIGGDLNQIVVLEYAIDEADYKKRKAADDKIMATEKGKDWEKQIQAILTSFEEIIAKPAPALSRPANR